MAHVIPHPTASSATSAALDSAHLGNIVGAMGTIRVGAIATRKTFGHRLRTLLAILGPGLIVMVGANDAGAFGTYTQAGQNYGTALMWTLLLLVPVLYINQEMVLRLGAVTGVGHGRLIFERFGKFWGAFSVIDLFALNALTIVTEFIGISLGLDYFGVNKCLGISIAALIIMAAASTGNFRRFERFSLVLVLGSLLLVPVIVMVHPPVGQMANDFFIPKLPIGSKLNEVMLLIIAIVGTTVAPWQLFFQQSYVIDKRITPRFIRYERVDLWIGIVLVIIGGVAMMGFAAHTFAGKPEFGNFADAGAVAAGMEKYFGRLPAVLFAIALIDACVIGASAVLLSMAYALGDVLSVRHSLHRKPTEAKIFYALYFGLIIVAAGLVLTPGTPLGLLTNLVQTLAGVLLPSATVFLLLLFPSISEWQILGLLGGGTALGVMIALGVKAFERRIGVSAQDEPPLDLGLRDSWRMPALHQLAPARITLLNKVWMLVLRGYLVIAAGLLLFKLFQLATAGALAA